jgi:putative FmdB family regulatory protein
VPTYQYACTECGHQLEAVQSFSDPALTECPSCEGKLRKVFNSVGIVFKGSGFYRNDSRSDKVGAEKAEKSEKSDKAEKTETATPKKADASSSSSDSSSSSTPSTSSSSASSSSSSGSSSGSSSSSSTKAAATS